MQLTKNYYGLLLGDNSFKVVRFDNNKSVINTSNVNFAGSSAIQSFDEYLIVQDGSQLQLYNTERQH